MNRILRCLPLLGLLLAMPAHAEGADPRLVRVTLDARVPLTRLLASGLDIASVHGGAAEVLVWPGDEATLAALGAQTQLVDADPGLSAARRSAAELAARSAPRGHHVRSAARPDGVTRDEELPGFGEGSLAGYWTLAEVKMKLDDLVASDTRDLVANKVDTLGFTIQGRPVWGLAIGKAVSGPDTRPLVYYSALTHAREPEGMEALFYFVDVLLNAYSYDPVSRYLLEHRRIYICPVVNPDGYRYNQQIYDTTATHKFGLWRKNLRDNDGNHKTDGNDGVDINRNYGFQWGYNNLGSSNLTNSDTYRGTAAFSEPETRIQRDVISALKPVTGVSFHTWSDLFLHPWGWTTLGTPDSAKFQEWSDELTLPTGFASGPSPRVLYEVNGEFNDWAYGDTVLKPRAFTWTPEIGAKDDGFWPPPSHIQPLASEMVQPNYTLAGIAGPWVRLEHASIAEGALNAGNVAHVSVRLRNIGATGLAGPGLSATLTPLDPGIQVLSGPLAYPTLGSFQSGDPAGGATFLVAAADTITPGRLLRLRVDISDAQGLACVDIVPLIVGTPTQVLLERGESLAQWHVLAGPWGVTFNDPVHPSSYISDSPYTTYPAGNLGELQLAHSLDLSHGVHAWALFDDRWAFDSDYDSGLFEASLDSVNWTALASEGTTASDLYSRVGAGLQVFDGTRWRWREDRADLSAFAGGAAASQVHLRFRSLSDGSLNLDGLDFDSLRVNVYDPAAQPAPVAVGSGPRPATLRFAPPAPNPASAFVRFEFETPDAGPVTLEVTDVQGRRMFARSERIPAGADGAAAASHYAWGWNLRDGGGRRVPPGLYLARLTTGAAAAVRRVVVIP